MKKTLSPNFDERGDAPIDMLLLHYTGMLTAQGALDRLCDPQAKVSAHYFIDEAGNIKQLVPDEKRAWHAGKSFWADEVDINARSIGVELVNPGHEFGYVEFPDAQIQAFIHLAKELLTRHDIPFYRVLGHSDVAPARKTDPGEKFPWWELAKHNIGLWNEEINKHNAVFKPDDLGGREQLVSDSDKATLLESLRILGYDVAGVERKDLPFHSLVEAFQRHFNPTAINKPLQGVADPTTRGIAKGLATDLDFWINLQAP
jgi:N-acetylmuramoyl-L-alanine amidase